MRLIAFLSALAVILTVHAQDKGVSAQLARQRKAEVHNPAYHLKFRIPDSAEKPVEGELILDFDFSGTGSLMLDFQGKLKPEGELNGKRFTAEVANEHIALPANLLKKGHNELKLRFESSDKALNRHADYLYTLFVPALARSVFPAFDQPDLKARFTLTLEMPESWTAQSAGLIMEDKAQGDLRIMAFADL